MFGLLKSVRLGQLASKIEAKTKIGIYKCVRVQQNVMDGHQNQNCDLEGQIASPPLGS